MLDSMFLNCVGYVSGMFDFFMSQANILARICFCLSLGIACVKMAFGVEQMNAVLVKALIGIIAYLIMINLFPVMMLTARGMMTGYAKGAVKPKYTSKYSPEELGVWADEIGQKAKALMKKDKDEAGKMGFLDGVLLGNPLTAGTYGAYRAYKLYKGNGVVVENQRVGLVEAAGGPRVVFGLNIAHSGTGLLSLDKLVVQVMATCSIMINSVLIKMDDEGGFINKWKAIIKNIPDFLLVLVICLFYIYCMALATVNYAACVIEYMFVYAVGVMFIPFMLWEGTKDYFSAVIGAFSKVLVKLLMVSIAIYMVLVGSIDIIANMYQASIDGDATLGQRFEFYAGVAFLCVFLKMIVDNAENVASLLGGGQPSLSFKDFQAAARSLGGAGATVAGGAVAAAKLGGQGAATMGGIAMNTVGGAIAGGKAGGIGGAFMGGATALAGSTVNGAASMIGYAGKMAKSLPGGVLKSMNYGMNPNQELSFGAVGFDSLHGWSKGKHEGAQKGPVGVVGNDGLTDGQRMMKSSNATDRNKAMLTRFNEYRAEGKGFFGAIRSAVRDRHVGESAYNPSLFFARDELFQQGSGGRSELGYNGPDGGKPNLPFGGDGPSFLPPFGGGGDAGSNVVSGGFARPEIEDKSGGGGKTFYEIGKEGGVGAMLGALSEQQVAARNGDRAAYELMYGNDKTGAEKFADFKNQENLMKLGVGDANKFNEASNRLSEWENKVLQDNQKAFENRVVEDKMKEFGNDYEAVTGEKWGKPSAKDENGDAAADRLRNGTNGDAGDSGSGGDDKGNKNPLDGPSSGGTDTAGLSPGGGDTKADTARKDVTYEDIFKKDGGAFRVEVQMQQDWDRVIAGKDGLFADHKGWVSQEAKRIFKDDAGKEIYQELKEARKQIEKDGSDESFEKWNQSYDKARDYFEKRKDEELSYAGIANKYGLDAVVEQINKDEKLADEGMVSAKERLYNTSEGRGVINKFQFEEELNQSGRQNDKEYLDAMYAKDDYKHEKIKNWRNLMNGGGIDSVDCTKL